jgi:hypothetical protein
MLAFVEVLERLGIFVRAMGGDDVLPFGPVDLLKTLFEQWKHCETVALLIGRQEQNNRRLKVGKHLRMEKLGSKAGLVGGDASGQLLPIHSEGYLDLIGLLQAILDHAIWQPVGSQRGPLFVPVELGCGHGLEEIRHGWDGKPSLDYNYSGLLV